MPIGSCRGDINRSRIARDFTIQPLLHTHVPGKHSIHSCCEREVGTFYYLLKSQNKTNPNDKQHFYAGRCCAEALLKRCGVAFLPAVSNFTLPASETALSPSRKPAIPPGSPREVHCTVTPLNREAQTVLTLLVMTIWPEPPKPGKAIEGLLSSISQNPSRDMQFRELKGLSTTVSSFTHKDGFAGIANALERKFGEPIKSRDFPHLRAAFARNKIPDPIHSL